LALLRSAERKTKTARESLTRLASQLEPSASGTIQELLENSDLVASAAEPAAVVTMYTQVLLQAPRPPDAI